MVCARARARVRITCGGRRWSRRCPGRGLWPAPRTRRCTPVCVRVRVCVCERARGREGGREREREREGRRDGGCLREGRREREVGSEGARRQGGRRRGAGVVGVGVSAVCCERRGAALLRE